MTNLMQQLQAWADEGRYDWENGTFNFKGTKRFHPYLSMDEDQQEKYHTLDWKALVQLVLDGTIRVWRSVEHYPQPLNGVYLGWNGKLKCHMLCNSGGDVFVIEYCMMNVTHWMPLQPPQEVSDES
jgi:hypothetical protein